MEGAGGVSGELAPVGAQDRGSPQILSDLNALQVHEEHAHGLHHPSSKASLDQLLMELVDPFNKGRAALGDPRAAARLGSLHRLRLASCALAAALSTWRLALELRMYHNGRNASIVERLHSLGGVYPQQALHT